MPTPRRWDIFCTVIDNHGDLGVCWRLAAQLRARGQTVRLWVDQAQALAWMAPQAGQDPLLQVLPWDAASDPTVLAQLAPSDVWIEAFGCHLPEAFVAHAATRGVRPPVWVNLEYLSAEDWVARMHALPSPVQTGPARGWTKHFFFPGFVPGTGGLLREPELPRAPDALRTQAWRAARGATQQAACWSLFCYEPAALPDLLEQAAEQGAHVMVTPGRAQAAVQAALRAGAPTPAHTALAHTDQAGFDDMLHACDLNLVRGEDSLVRALWAGAPLIWQLYPQHDNAHHDKLNAFLDWLGADADWREAHRVWNGVTQGPLPPLTPARLQRWAHTLHAARARLLAQDDLCTQLLRQVTGWAALPV